MCRHKSHVLAINGQYFFPALLALPYCHTCACDVRYMEYPCERACGVCLAIHGMSFTQSLAQRDIRLRPPTLCPSQLPWHSSVPPVACRNVPLPALQTDHLNEVVLHAQSQAILTLWMPYLPLSFGLLQMQ